MSNKIGDKIKFCIFPPHFQNNKKQPKQNSYGHLIHPKNTFNTRTTPSRPSQLK